ncbi:MAG: hypothetical protein QME47_00615 [Candidatus Thermoplasmatota archaeon]|nr:hypothetical protein [Candidatus Thermoplasmatota archaeon]
MVRIPKDIAKFLKLDKGKEVFVTIGGKHKLVVEAC